MNLRIENIKHFRRFLLSQIAETTTVQLNTVPTGFNNNIIWNLAHLVAVQQTLCYTRSGQPTVIAQEYIAPYMPGTKPDKVVNDEEIAMVKEQMITSIDRMQADYEANVFIAYTRAERIKQVYNIEVTNIDEAIDFILYHEGFHIGCILALKHLV